MPSVLRCSAMLGRRGGRDSSGVRHRIPGANSVVPLDSEAQAPVTVVVIVC